MKVRDSLVTRRCNRNIDISESGRRDVPANETEINTISPFPWHEKNCDDPARGCGRKGRFSLRKIVVS